MSGKFKMPINEQYYFARSVLQKQVNIINSKDFTSFEGLPTSLTLSLAAGQDEQDMAKFFNKAIEKTEVAELKDHKMIVRALMERPFVMSEEYRKDLKELGKGASETGEEVACAFIVHVMRRGDVDGEYGDSEYGENYGENEYEDFPEVGEELSAKSNIDNEIDNDMLDMIDDYTQTNNKTSMFLCCSSMSRHGQTTFEFIPLALVNNKVRILEKLPYREDYDPGILDEFWKGFLQHRAKLMGII